MLCYVHCVYINQSNTASLATLSQTLWLMNELNKELYAIICCYLDKNNIGNLALRTSRDFTIGLFFLKACLIFYNLIVRDKWKTYQFSAKVAN